MVIAKNEQMAMMEMEMPTTLLEDEIQLDCSEERYGSWVGRGVPVLSMLVMRKGRMVRGKQSMMMKMLMMVFVSCHLDVGLLRNVEDT